MMGIRRHSTCLRCDWQGETTEPLCPNCGARSLYVLAPPSSREPGRTAPEERRPDPLPPVTEAGGASGRSSRWVVTFVVAGLVLTVIVGSWFRTHAEGAAPPPFTGAPAQRPADDGGLPSVEPSPPPKTQEIARITRLGIGRYGLTAEGVPFSFRTRTRGWFKSGRLFVSKSSVGPQGAEAIVLWTDVDRGAYARACGQWWGSPGGSAADFALQASKARGTELVEGPSKVVVGGQPAQQVVFTVQRDVGCNPGFFHTWRAVEDGPFWTSTEIGDTIRIWLVDVDGTLLYIEGDTHTGAGPQLEREVQRIVDSIRFE